MEAIGYTGDQRYATTTEPFDTRRHGAELEPVQRPRRGRKVGHPT